MATVQDVIDEIIDRAHYATGPGGPHEVRYISINEHALRAAIATVLYKPDPVGAALTPRHLSTASLAQAVGTGIVDEARPHPWLDRRGAIASRHGRLRLWG
jgi:hypothetical protein